MCVCLREMTAGVIFSSGPSTATVQIRKTFLVASAVLLTEKDCSKSAPTSKLGLQYQTVALNTLFRGIFPENFGKR